MFVIVVDVADLGCAGVGPALPGRIGLGRAQLLPDHLGRVEDVDGVAPRLRHLGLAIEAHDPPGAGEQRLRLQQHPGPAPVGCVPPAREFARELEVLHLVVTHRHLFGTVQQDVRGHEDGIVEQPGRDALELRRLIFELGHALEFAQRSDGIEQPHELGVRRHMRLHKQGGPVGIDSRGQYPDRHVQRALAMQRRVVERTGDGMQVHDAEGCVVFRLQTHPVLHRAEQVSDVELAGGLNSREYTRHAAEPSQQ